MQALFFSLLFTTPIIAVCTWLYVRVRRQPLSPLKRHLSTFIFLFSCTAAVATVITTLWWISIVASEDGWEAMVFMLIGSTLGAGSFFFPFVPSAFFYSHWRSKRDLHSLWVSGSTIFALIVETATLFCIPLHGC